MCNAYIDKRRYCKYFFFTFQNDYCKEYESCEKRLEMLQRQCIKLEEHANKNHKECYNLLSSARAAVDGLQLRKAELERDCLQQTRNAGLIDKLDYFQMRCERIARSLPSNIQLIRYPESIKDCRKSSRSIRKQCHTLAPCCHLHR
ncbi:unnamed protein product [Thelazia callipaeda]|uniref:Uncharacterized protein n=1 Tax=Thelazia callipaeda TaxID=103827 RepID=A0A0N5D476_THECL|nr:unnamed protein product [Thelazia callipaeda]